MRKHVFVNNQRIYAFYTKHSFGLNYNTVQHAYHEHGYNKLTDITKPFLRTDFSLSFPL